MDTFDVVVVGTGAAGMSAALTAAMDGRSVLILEKTKQFGGSTAVSGGVVWIPNAPELKTLSLNYYLTRVGIGDTLEKARAYLEATVGDVVPSERRETYLVEGPAMLRQFARTRWVRWEHWPFPDYYAEALGGLTHGRALQPRSVSGLHLGAELAQLRRLGSGFQGLIADPKDGFGMAAGWRSPRGPASYLRAMGKTVISVALRRQTLTMGRALVARLRLALLDLDVPMWLSAPVTALMTETGTDGSTRVTGVRVLRNRTEHTVSARQGVVLASGGFARSAELRSTYLPAPTDTAWTIVPSSGQDGDAITLATALRAAIELTDKAWGFQVAMLPVAPGTAPTAHMAFYERSKPGVIVVDSSGHRFVDESTPYDRFWNEVYRLNRPEASTIPAWMIFDSRVKRRYPLFGTRPGRNFPEHWIREGHVLRAHTLEDLARGAGLPEAALRTTVARFNGFVRKGHDDDFQRGDTAFSRFLGDATLPSPALNFVDRAPFYAVRLYPGDLGTKGGLKVDERARVLRSDGTPIRGLYAAGNASSSVMGAVYPGAGATIGPAAVFGYVASKTLATDYRQRGNA